MRIVDVETRTVDGQSAALGGILWVLRNRASWRDMPARFGNDNTAYKRYRPWSDTGL